MSATNPLVSIIMPAYNAAPFIGASIESVLKQSHGHWELLVINDGSKDATEQVVLSFNDARIRYFHQQNRGVSSARNLGLQQMRGDFLCFLDADDLLPSTSLERRLAFMHQHPGVQMLDSQVDVYNADFSKRLRTYAPAYSGLWWKGLITLNSACFFGPNVFLRNNFQILPMKEGLTHGEDYLFYLNNAVRYQLVYHFLPEVCYLYRQSNSSAMSNLAGLEKGYNRILGEVKKMPEVGFLDWKRLELRIMRILLLSFVAARQYGKGLSQLGRLFRSAAAS
ncbi:glycosyltransferase family 2 protein [Paraflavisolibacter sp. H34]|uniref:glycosyltransferase family 2 protein n=1 Tax=Huijunlia imazamoxiresistens TaxID=3127457 RepID=UPI0030164ED0